MTSTIAFPCWVIGLMSGTSADGVDAALLYTDGRDVAKPGASLFVPYAETLRADILAAMQPGAVTTQVGHALTEVHRQAVEQLLATGGVPREEVKLIGFHGQTVLHRPAEGITIQIGEAGYLAQRTGIPVVADFRSADVAAGGQGAPLVPLYHAALAHRLEKPLMLVNIGGVSNVTWIGADEEDAPSGVGVALPADVPTPASHGANLLAFDCGPGNALMDDWTRRHTGARCDAGGAIAAKGVVNEALVDAFLADPFFAQPVPKSLDRHHFHAIIERMLAAKLTLEDGMATLAAMTAAGIAEAARAVPEAPKRVLVCGGGRHNPTLMGMLKRYQLPVAAVEEAGWNGDMLEAEAFAYLAARSVQELPLSLPSTTGVARPTTGGSLFMPHHHHDDEDDDCTTPRSCCR